MVDCISGGRLEGGLVRGVTCKHQIFAANTNPTQTNERLWQGVDMLIKAWTMHDGPFNYEGPFWHRRNINIWPRPYQQPRPRIWITGSSDKENIKLVARARPCIRDLPPAARQGEGAVRHLSRELRRQWRAGGDRLHAAGLHCHLETEAAAGAEELSWYLRTKAEPQFKNPPGHAGIDLNVQALKGAFESRSSGIRAQGLDYLREEGIVLYGTPTRLRDRSSVSTSGSVASITC